MRYPVSQPCLDGAKELILKTLDTNWITSGPMVRAFEARLAELFDVRADCVVATSSGTTALHLALAALGIGEGDEVIVPDLTYIATANAVRYVGAQPRFVDVDPATFCMNVAQVARHINRRTRAIIPVHLYGSAVDMNALETLVCKRDIHIIEDAAEAFTGLYQGRSLGTFGDVGCFSFFGNKIITTGEGGACVVRNPLVAKRLRSLGGMANDPQQRYRHLEVGFNYRMTDMQAAVGLSQLTRLTTNLARRSLIFQLYEWRLRRANVFFPKNVTAPWLFTCLLPEDIDRAQVMAQLAEAGIETRPTFVPMHEHRMFHDHGVFPVADLVSRTGISLPTYEVLSPWDISYICDALIEAIS